jgi:phosphoribosyl 1,2-cyclic phosphate phosphodiesterase
MHAKLPVKAFRIGRFTYITDANYIAPEEIEKIKGSDVVVINGLQQDKHLSHFNLKQAIEVIEEIAPKKAYITHISHRLGLHSVVQQQLPDFVHLAYDGLQINLDTL